MDVYRFNGVSSDAKGAKKAEAFKGVKAAFADRQTTRWMRSVADQERAFQLLDKAKTRDLTPDELKILSVVQLSQYAIIRQKRQTESS